MNTVKRAGFTLVELAIVLVIIGLLVGGVLVGADLIKAATMRSTLTQIANVETGALTFRTKYNGFPGDLKNATAYFSAITPTTNANGQGDGDGIIETVSAAGTVCTTRTCEAGESVVFGYQIYQAGYIKEAQTVTSMDAYSPTLVINDTYIPLKLGNGSLVPTSAAGKNYFILAAPATSVAAGVGTMTAGLTGQQASNIDDKLDDGIPNTGGIISVAIDTGLAGTAANSATSVTSQCYDSDTGPSYFAQDDTLRCTVSLRTSF